MKVQVVEFCNIWLTIPGYPRAIVVKPIEGVPGYPTEELSRQGYFQWIYSLRAAGSPEISVVSIRNRLSWAQDLNFSLTTTPL